MPQANHHRHVVLGARNNNRQILILLIVSVKHDQLLIAMRGIVEGIEIESDVARRSLKRLNEQVDEDVPQTPQVGDRDSILKSRERGLTGQVRIIG